MMRRVGAWGLAIAMFPWMTLAHPHVFVDTGLSLEIDAQGHLRSLRTIWVMDEVTTSLMIEANALDPDGDGMPDPQALSALAGAEMDWSVFREALHLQRGGQAIVPPQPTDRQALFQGGVIALMSTWELPAPMDLSRAPLVMQVYDQTFYIAYEVAYPVAMSSEAPCEVVAEAADLSEAQRQLEEMFDAMPVDAILENDFPEIGAFYADTVTVSCN